MLSEKKVMTRLRLSIGTKCTLVKFGLQRYSLLLMKCQILIDLIFLLALSMMKKTVNAPRIWDSKGLQAPRNI